MSTILFRNANLLLDLPVTPQTDYDVLVKGKHIDAVSPSPIKSSDATIIDVHGMTLMPGLIDAHAHITGLTLSPRNIAFSSAEIAVACANYLKNSLLDGFTTIREAGGADHSIARLLAEEAIVGPRLFYSGRALTQTGGGADFRAPNELDRPVRSRQPVLRHVGNRRWRR